MAGMWKKALNHFKSQAAIGEIVGKRQSVISYKIVSGHPIPAEWVEPLVVASDGRLSKPDLRPDLWPQA